MIGIKAPYPWWTPEAKKSLDRLQKSLTQKKNKQECLFLKSNGDHFWVESTTIPIENEDQSHYF
jgi:hypothetical protein